MKSLTTRQAGSDAARRGGSAGKNLAMNAVSADVRNSRHLPQVARPLPISGFVALACRDAPPGARPLLRFLNCAFLERGVTARLVLHDAAQESRQVRGSGAAASLTCGGIATRRRPRRRRRGVVRHGTGQSSSECAHAALDRTHSAVVILRGRSALHRCHDKDVHSSSPRRCFERCECLPEDSDRG